MSPSVLSLKQALPYLRKFRGTKFVIKIGGSLLGREVDLAGITENISALHHVGIQVLVVHGGGPQLNQLAKELGQEQTTIGGRRVTNAKTLELAKMVFAGKINTELVSKLNAVRAPAVGLTGLDATMVLAKKRPPQEGVDYVFVGDILEIRPKLIEEILSANWVPVVASLAGDGTGQIFNINADTIAAQIAIALKAEKYINLTDAPGILQNVKEPNSLISYMDIQTVEVLKRDGVLSGGMLPKAQSCIAAIQGGVKQAHIINGQETDSLLKEIFTNEGCGTLIVERIEKNGH
jgi:acetylglutamate kinase